MLALGLEEIQAAINTVLPFGNSGDKDKETKKKMARSVHPTASIENCPCGGDSLVGERDSNLTLSQIRSYEARPALWKTRTEVVRA